MTDRERLIDLFFEASRTYPKAIGFTEYLADYLISHGVIVPPSGGKIMTPIEFKKVMQLISEKNKGNEESVHIAMDNLMCNLLVSLGYNEGVEIFNETKKWYS